MAKKASTKKKAAGKKKAVSKKAGSKKVGGKAGKGLGYKAGDAIGKELVIVESPSKGKTINKYLGDGYLVLASVGHVRDLPSKNPKGVKDPVPGVKVENRFQPTYETLDGKEAVVRDLKRAAKDAKDVWFATDLDREGEAIAWHLAEVLGIDAKDAKRVIFPAITKSEIGKAFNNPHPIDIDRVNAQQARRILDRIVGYQVSPLLWKKVARGLSAGRVQSVAVRVVVERERAIDAFVPDENWAIQGYFGLELASAKKLGPAWRGFLDEKDEKGNGPTVKKRNAWLGQQHAIKAELVEVGGKKPEFGTLGGDGAGFEKKDGPSKQGEARRVAELAGLKDIVAGEIEDPDGKGPGRWKRSVSGVADPTLAYMIRSIETKRTRSHPSAPFITSTLQQAASSRLGFGAQRTMRAAQSLYEGVNIPGEGPVGLITYMRTDATFISNDALEMARAYISDNFGPKYLPDAPKMYKSSNKAAQEAHEAIRPTSLVFPPKMIAKALKPDELRLYTLIWERFVSCQMTPAQWDSTAVLLDGGIDPSNLCTFKASGRTLVFDGFYRVAGIPSASEDQHLPKLEEKQNLHPFDITVDQKFTAPPARFTEASLIKVLESEGIGRPSTYASIISVIQNRKYVEQIERRFYATDLGEVVTDKLVEAFPEILDIGYTREMEAQLDKIEEEHLDWIDMLDKFYGPFIERLERAHEDLVHAKAEIRPAPKEYRCATCDSDMVYRFGKNGRFLSCSRYPDCKYASPCDRSGKPQMAEFVDIKCPLTGRPMIRKTGRFGPFIATPLEEGESNGEVGLILNIDKKGFVVAPSVPPLGTEILCEKCESPLNLRNGVRGPWLGCSRFPKCRGRGKWTEIEEGERGKLEKALAAHEAKHPIPVITRMDGTALTNEKGKPLENAPRVDELVLEGDPRESSSAA